QLSSCLEDPFLASARIAIRAGTLIGSGHFHPLRLDHRLMAPVLMSSIALTDRYNLVLTDRYIKLISYLPSLSCELFQRAKRADFPYNNNRQSFGLLEERHVAGC